MLLSALQFRDRKPESIYVETRDYYLFEVDDNRTSRNVTRASSETRDDVRSQTLSHRSCRE